MAKCSMCDRKFEDSYTPEGICKECRETHWLPPNRPPSRPQVPCTRCQGRSFVRARAIRERGASGSDYVHEYIAWLAATYQHQSRTTLFAGREVDSPDPLKPVGVFEAYICRSCGFVEWYVLAPETIPIGPEYATDLFELPADGPYR